MKACQIPQLEVFSQAHDRILPRPDNCIRGKIAVTCFSDRYAMKPLPISLVSFLLAVLLLTACQGGTSDQADSRQYLQSEFAPATYPSLLDSAVSSGELTPEARQQTLAFIRSNATVIPAGLTLSNLSEAAEGAAGMKAGALELEVDRVNITTNRKIYGFHLHLTAFNRSEAGVERVRGVIEWLDSEGKLLKTSPRFSIKGPMAPGDSVDQVLLETAYYRPTGNELNDPRLRAWRDTLKLMEQSAGSMQPERFRFRQLDLQLDNGMSVDRYWLQTAADRKASATAAAQPEKVLSLRDWADDHSDWLDKLRAGLGEHYLEITPILTNKGELTHGDYLVFDRIRKVKDFFVKQKKVPGRRINPDVSSGELVHFSEVDFWKWPMELRIYEADVD